ncbi:MAG: methyltransferase domain-containing protein [Candidatus Pacebacteria bacterium]|nr:methyltransferase domain-containing protein [Candidatus Paceibacterota bacterium]
MEERNSYDNLYAQQESVFSAEPQECVRHIADHMSHGMVLELGAGDGRNALFLARSGFDVTAQDTSTVGVEKMKERALSLGVDITAEVRDAREEIDGTYDCIVSTFVLHHLSREDALRLIKRMQDAAPSGGLNVLSTFTKQGDFYTSNPDASHFYANQDELRELYRDWEILEHQERTGPARQRKPDGSPMMNTWVELIARKRTAP